MFPTGISDGGDYEASEQDVDNALQELTDRRSSHSFNFGSIAGTSPSAASHLQYVPHGTHTHAGTSLPGSVGGSGASSPSASRGSARLHSVRSPGAEEGDFVNRLLQEHGPWRESAAARPGLAASSSGRISLVAGAVSGAGSSGGGEGLQNQTHAALQQLRGELKSLSLRSMGGGGGGAGSASGAGAPVHQPPTAAAGSMPLPAVSAAPVTGQGAALSGAGRHGEGLQQQQQMSPSRLSVTYTRRLDQSAEL